MPKTPQRTTASAKRLESLVGTVHSIPPPNLATCTREELQEYLENTWGLEESLFSALKDDSVFQKEANPLRRPLIFYYAHTAVSYVNKMLLSGLVQDRVHPEWESLFAVGVDEMSWDDQDLNSKCVFPAAQEIREYRQKVFDTVSDVIANAELKLPITQKSAWWALAMGMEHHRIHLETSSVLMRELPVEFLRRPESWVDAESFGVPPRNELVEIPDGRVTLGKPLDFPSYGWDNEYGKKEVTVPRFLVSKFLVTNYEFLDFVRDDGYKRKELWTEEGWNWVTYKNAEHPVFWKKDGNSFKYRAMFDIREMPWDWPVDINFHEAKAFCAWKGKDYRVITEAEWHRCRDSSDNDVGVERDIIFSKDLKANLNMSYGSASPVDMFPPTEAGVYDVHGNVWEWAEDYFYGLPGFETHPLYDDFSTPCFDSEHNMIMGGSWISTGDEASIFARYAFRRHFFQHLGFRYVKSEFMPANDQSIRPNAFYETDLGVSQYILFHYGEKEDIFPYSYDGISAGLNFHSRIAKECLDAVDAYAEREVKRALDLGCSVGRATFELSRGIPFVLGLDFSVRFVGTGCRLQEQRSIDYVKQEEGTIQVKCTATLADDIDTSRVEFKQADACNLPPTIGHFDLVLCSNLFDRLSNPQACIASLPKIINKGGLLVVASPWSWEEQYTPKEKWLGSGDGAHASLTELEKLLAPSFEMVGEPKDIPFLLREHKRKFQFGISQLTIWRRT